MMPAIFRHWSELPFREIWLIDFEFYPGHGLANGGREGDKATPLCLVAREARTGRVIRQWQDEFGRFPPYPLDADALIVSYMISAEFGCHAALDWGQPASALDAYIEFRHFVNDGAVESGERERGFFSLAGALQYFCEDSIDTAHKADMRERIMRGPTFTAAERAAFLEYCEEDVDALTRLLPHIVPTIRSLPHAMLRAKFAWTIAQQERRGVPLDRAWLDRIQTNWSNIQLDLVTAIDREFGCYEIRDGKPHWVKENFAACVHRRGIAWPTYADGSLDETAQTFRDMCRAHSELDPLRELRSSMSKLRLNDLHIGNDGRNRAMLGPYGTKTGRNAPRHFIFGPAKWLRFLIAPSPGRVLIHRDYKQQEPQIAAVQSNDAALLEACLSGDVYLGIAEQLGFLRDGMSVTELEMVRALFKTVVLGILYGLAPPSLAIRTGISPFEAAEILARLRARFCAFEAYVQCVADHAGLQLEIGTPYGWFMQCPPGINPRTVRNYPIQSTGAEIMHTCCILAERRGIEIVAPIHDAFVVEADASREAEASAALDQVMRDASRIVLRGYELQTDCQVIHHGERYFDKRGQAMWDTVTKLVTKFERERVASGR